MSYAGPMTAEVKFVGNSNATSIFNGSDYAIATIPINGKATGVYAGRFEGAVLKYSGVPASIFVDNLNNLYMYCYDILQHIGGGNTVQYTINLNGESSRTLDFLGAVNAKMSSGRVYDPFAWLRPVSNGQAAAIQLGIWKSKYETNEDVWAFDEGTFQLSTSDRETLIWWDSFRDEITKSDSLDEKYVMVLENSAKQDMITGDPIPEPGSLALLGLGLGGLAFAQRKRIKRAA